MKRWLAILLLMLGMASVSNATAVYVKVEGYPEMVLGVPRDWQRFEIYWEWSEGLQGPWKRAKLLSPYNSSPGLPSGGVPIYLRLRAERRDVQDPFTGRGNYVPPFWWSTPPLPPGDFPIE